MLRRGGSGDLSCTSQRFGGAGGTRRQGAEAARRRGTCAAPPGRRDSTWTFGGVASAVGQRTALSAAGFTDFM